MSRFKKGDLVWAKMKGFPPWPAKITDDSITATDIPYGKYRVYFFGTKEIAVMKSSELYHYAERKNDFEIQRKIKGFNEGIEEIRTEAGDLASPTTSPIRRSARLSQSIDIPLGQSDANSDHSHSFDEFLLPSLPKRAVSNSNMLSNSERSIYSMPDAQVGIDLASSVKFDRKRHASTNSNSSRTKRSRQSSTADLLDFDPLLATDPTLPSLMNDAIYDGFDGDEHRSRRRRRTSSRLEPLGSPMKYRDRSISNSSGRMRLLSGFSDVFDELFDHSHLIFNPNELMNAIDMLTNEESDHAPTPEVPHSTETGRKCYECGSACELLDTKWRCSNKTCMKWNGVQNENHTLNLDNIPLNLDLPKTSIMSSRTRSDTMINSIAQIKQELQADEPTSSFNPVIPTEQQSATQNFYPYGSNSIDVKPPNGFYLDSMNSTANDMNGLQNMNNQMQNPMSVKTETQPVQPQVEMTTAASLNLNFYMEKNKKTGRPKSYKVEKTPPISATTGMRHCLLCNGQVRPQMCGGNKHRWRCVDKKCRKWYGWVKSDDEIPKDLGKKGRWRELALRGQNGENGDETKYGSFLTKAMANRPVSRRSRAKNSLHSKLDGSNRQDLTPFERKSRWWINEKYRNDVSPEREFSNAILDTAATFKIMGTAMMNAATTKISGETNGYTDLLMDSLMSSMGPLLSMTSKAFPQAAPPEAMQKIWKASAVHTPMF